MIKGVRPLHVITAFIVSSVGSLLVGLLLYELFSFPFLSVFAIALFVLFLGVLHEILHSANGGIASQGRLPAAPNARFNRIAIRGGGLGLFLLATILFSATLHLNSLIGHGKLADSFDRVLGSNSILFILPLSLTLGVFIFAIVEVSRAD